jgi:hypothetical protein
MHCADVGAQHLFQQNVQPGFRHTSTSVEKAQAFGAINIVAITNKNNFLIFFPRT